MAEEIEEKKETPEEEKPLIPLEPYIPPVEEKVSIQHLHRGTDTPRISYNDLLNKPTTITDHGELTGLADDDHPQYVHNTGDETIAGIKTFSSFSITPSSAPTTDYQTANKKYVNNEDGYLAGNTLLRADTGGSQTASTTYIKLMTITIGKSGGTFRIKFNMNIGNAIYTAQGIIRRNRGGDIVSVGTPQSTQSEVPVTFSEDISGWLKGDVCELWVKTTSGSSAAWVSNLSLYGLNPSEWSVWHL